MCEYDLLWPYTDGSIMESLQPFYGLPIETLKQRGEEVEKIPETYTAIVEDGKVEVQWNDNYSRDVWIQSRGRADAQINLMDNFIALLPDFRATFTIHDQPSILLNYERRKDLMDAASQHKGELRHDDA
jgi:beta-1,2-xylosyltransferase